jgi:photosystem II stability/assembly factor-like uncharacterized protein
VRSALPAVSAAAVLVVAIASVSAQDQAPTRVPAGTAVPATAAAATPASRSTADSWSGLKFRGIGPALTSGRIGDLAVDPSKPSRWYVAAASGGVWKTENAGTSWSPIFDGEGSYSIGCITLDPRDPLTVWVGTGESNNQRSVSYGDGVYKSVDGGKNWKRMGLEASEHVGRIVVHPKDSDVVFVAAYGPLWSSGGDRGLYKTTDGGKTWRAVLTVSPNTGISDLVMDPRNPDVLIAAAHQRRRHVFTYISGGPESALYKSTDGGESWRKVTTGLPREDLGRIGLAFSPAAPATAFAIVETDGDAGGFFRSTDGGETWEKRGDHQTSGNYYAEIVADPKDADRVYSMDVFLQVTDDGGKTFRNLGEAAKHVDNHAIWVDPANTDHYLVGGDGGLYESFDRAATWRFVANLPVTQFYRVTVDNSEPVYYVYGGTQDNYSLGGPSRTLTAHGITNQDWFVTWSGDGFHSRVDPANPNIVYATLQYGVLGRYDRKSGEAILIQPQEGNGEPPLRWNWDSPLLISPHRPTRLYFAANRLFRSEDRGDSWTPVSPDLTRQIDRNTLEVMGRVWGPDAVAKNESTSFYGNIVSLDESPIVEGLLYVGTDDGLVQVSEDAGATWRKEEKFPGVPERTYVSDLVASRHDANVVYAAFNNHKQGDFRPYLLRSADRGRTWAALGGALPANGPVWTIVEDHVDRALLFAGTEFGVHFSADAGVAWTRLKGGLPTIAVRDIAIQERENDLVVATFGRGFYVLDDYSPLRWAGRGVLTQPDATFPVRKTRGFIPSTPLGMRGKAFLGEALYTAPNPPDGAVLTYYLAEEIKSLKAVRRAAEEAAQKKSEAVAYPTREAFVAEAREEAPAVVITISDAGGRVVRRLTGPTGAGVHRVAWDLRYPAADPVPQRPAPTDNPFYDPPTGPMVVPGTYTAAFARRVGGTLTPFGAPQTFTVEALNLSSLPPANRAELLAFQQDVARLQRAVLGANQLVRETETRLILLRKAADETPAADPALATEVRSLQARLQDIQVALTGDAVTRRRSEPVPTSLTERVESIVNAQWSSTSPATGTSREAYRIASEEFEPVLERLRALVETDLRRVEDALDAAGAPWTPGRVPTWRKP